MGEKIRFWVRSEQMEDVGDKEEGCVKSTRPHPLIRRDIVGT